MSMALSLEGHEADGSRGERGRKKRAKAPHEVCARFDPCGNNDVELPSRIDQQEERGFTSTSCRPVLQPMLLISSDFLRRR